MRVKIDDNSPMQYVNIATASMLQDICAFENRDSEDHIKIIESEDVQSAGLFFLTFCC